MTIAGGVLVFLAGIAMLVFGIQILIRAFKASLAWGLASLFVPFAAIVFVVKHWAETKRPFLFGLACVPLQALGFGLMLMGGATITVTPDSGPADARGATEPKSPPRVETATLVFETVTNASRSEDVSSLPPCGEASIGATVVAPKEARICARTTDLFGETKLDWKALTLEATAFGEPVEGQWISWLRIVKKESQEQVAFVIFQVRAAQQGRWMQLECDGGGMNRSQINGNPPLDAGFNEACAEVAEKLAVGRIQFDWNAKAPRVRFQSNEGPAIDLELVSVG